MGIPRAFLMSKELIFFGFWSLEKFLLLRRVEMICDQVGVGWVGR